MPIHVGIEGLPVHPLYRPSFACNDTAERHAEYTYPLQIKLASENTIWLCTVERGEAIQCASM